MPSDDGRIEELLRVLDHPVPAVTAEAIARRARRHRWPVRWAAAVLLLIGAAGAAFAFPGSPLRRWVAGIVARWSGGPATVAPPSPAPRSDSGSAGLAVPPGDALVIQFEGAAAGEVRVILADRPDVLVRAGTGRASFTSENRRLRIDARGVADTFAVEIPNAAPRVEIRVSGSRVFLKDGARTTAAVPADSTGRYRIPLAGQRHPAEPERVRP